MGLLGHFLEVTPNNYSIYHMATNYQKLHLIPQSYALENSVLVTIAELNLLQ